MSTIRELDLARVAAIMRDVAGHDLSGRLASIVNRIEGRLRATGAHSVAEYLARVDRDEAERTAMVEALCVHETSFFREARHFELLREIARAWRAKRGAPRTFRVWSAAASTGEEAFSIAMVLLDEIPRELGLHVEIAATDLSAAALARAEAAMWPTARLAEIPMRSRAHVVEQGSMFGVRPEVRQLVRFSRENLVALSPQLTGPFEIVFCRNVLFYLTRPLRTAVLASIAARLAPGGLLFLGHADSSLDARGLKFVEPGVLRVEPR